MAAGRSLNLTDQPVSLPQSASSRSRSGGVPGFGWADYLCPPGHNVLLTQTIAGTGVASIVAQTEIVLG